jgi:hexosaminidase
MKLLLLVLVVACALVPQLPAQRSLNLMPLPAKAQTGNGQLAIDPSFSVSVTGYNDARLARAVDRFLDDLRHQTGMVPLDFKVAGQGLGTLVLHADRASKEIPELGEDESYSLEITSAGAKLNAPTPLGIMHGLQTFLQLVETTSAGFAIPAVSIQDQPRFIWRGLMIDVGRHFIPLHVLKRNVDGMAAVKLNVLHLHLSENQGFRVESKKFPKLQEMGSDGDYYTQEQIRDFIDYAADRGIRVVPEFDMPGHSTSFLVGYPEIGSGRGPYTLDRRWGVLDPAMDPTQERTYKFLDDFIGEMAKLFPDHYFHIGGDEVNGKEWDANPKIQQFKKQRNIKSNAELQAYFSSHVQEIVSKHNKIMVGWDEVLQPGLPKDVIVQSWRGPDSLAQGAKDGYGVILSSGYYLDLIQPASQHYAVDPLSGAVLNLTPEQQKHILGGESCMWSEYVGPETIDSRIWPRNAAIAERFWSPQSVTDVDSMYQRMAAISRWLDNLGLTHNSSYEPMLRRIAGGEDISALRTLADVVESVKEYDRPDQAITEPTAFTPLNRLVDAARPESMTARDFARLVNTFVAGTSDPAVEAQIRLMLARWRDNDAILSKLQGQTVFIPEILPLSQDLAVLGTAGIQALDYIDRKEPAPDAWKAEQMALVAQAAKPKAQLLLMVAPAVQKLVEASAAAVSPVPAQ